MKNFPSLMAVFGAWLCAFGFVPYGIAAFLVGSLWILIVQEDVSWYNLAFLAANLVAFLRIT